MSSSPARGVHPAVALVLALLVSACGIGGAPASGVGVAPPGPTPAPGAALSNAEIEALYRARTAAARERFTEADVRFMTGMIHHHAQAVEMSRLAPVNEASRSVRTLAARIINAQLDEMETMGRWLQDRGRDVPTLSGLAGVSGEPPHGHGAHGGAGAGHDAHEGMPGMIHPDRMEALAAARGVDFDRLFLTLMIEHHRGAVTMVEELFAADGAAQDQEVFRFASDVQVDQLTEVARMEQMLEALGPAGDLP